MELIRVEMSTEEHRNKIQSTKIEYRVKEEDHVQYTCTGQRRRIIYGEKEYRIMYAV